jgi:hypothetical protein
VPEVLVQHLSLEAFRVVHLDPSVAPLDDLGVVVGQHFRQLIKELGDRMVLAVPIGDFAGQLVDPASGTGRAAVVVVGAIIQAAGGREPKQQGSRRVTSLCE